jgi:hypothetical protein
LSIPLSSSDKHIIIIIIIIMIIIIIISLAVGCRPVAVVIMHINKCEIRIYEI